VAHQHEVAITQDRGQDVVEVVRDAAGQLPDRLHLGRLGDFALQPRFLAIVLEAEEHCGVAEPARAGDGERDRLLRALLEAHRNVAGKGAAAAESAHCVRDGGLVLVDEQVAGPCGLGLGGEAGGAAEGAVQIGEAAVPVGEGEAQRQAVQQRVDVRRLVLAQLGGTGIVEQQEERQRLRRFGERHLDDAQRRSFPAFGGEQELAGVGRGEEGDQGGAVHPAPRFSERAGGERGIGGEDRPRLVGEHGHDARLAEPAPAFAGKEPRRIARQIGLLGPLEGPDEMAGGGAKLGPVELALEREFLDERAAVAAGGADLLGKVAQMLRRRRAAEPDAIGAAGADERALLVRHHDRRSRRIERGAEQGDVGGGLRFAGGGRRAPARKGEEQGPGACNACEEGGGEDGIAHRPEEKARRSGGGGEREQEGEAAAAAARVSPLLGPARHYQIRTRRSGAR
jgi:hypothetical protein